MPSSLNSQHSLRSAVGLSAVKPQHSLWTFSRFSENQLSLPTTATLLPVITPPSLHIQRIPALLVLCYCVVLTLATLLTESLVAFRNSHLWSHHFNPWPRSQVPSGSNAATLGFFATTSSWRSLDPAQNGTLYSGGKITLDATCPKPKVLPCFINLFS